MHNTVNYYDFISQIIPQNMNGIKLTYKVCIKSEYTRSDGTCAIYLNLYLDGVTKRLPLNISVPKAHFNKRKQRVYKDYAYQGDYNLLIEKVLADINAIEINYRLNNEILNLDKVIEDLTDPSLRINYNRFASAYLEKTKNGIKNSTYLQQKGSLSKIEKYMDPIPFNEITSQFVIDFRYYLKNKLNLKNSSQLAAG